ncbi:hypothetical protein GCM10007160_13530 [Litchfieldella qijiaojingensis]|uniref:Uncharacterized protein n=1 Tax=Litchfieldella qijiaojingensis TaxID=980347 RepID=A0ABQ2YMS7_9GAMM|nr:hypothetical protein [Halomonas qijiaojingensis]GGX87458.1 hypothetical protein GCM10007160_13530 [Halomonas qijiaojingensis]
MKTMILTASALAASLLMAGSAFAMDSDAIEKHMAEINQQAEQTTASKSRVEALENQVQQLQELIRMMLEEEDADTSS